MFLREPIESSGEEPSLHSRWCWDCRRKLRLLVSAVSFYREFYLL